MDNVIANLLRLQEYVVYQVRFDEDEILVNVGRPQKVGFMPPLPYSE